MVINQLGELVGIIIASGTSITTAGLTTFLLTTTPEVEQFINDFRADSQTGPGLPPNTDTNDNGFTELQEYHLDNLPKKFRVGDAVSLDLGAILLPLPTGQSLSMTGLPKGLRFDPVSGLLSGTITGLLGEAPVKILIKQGSRVIGSVLFDLKVDLYAFLGSYEVLIEEAGGLPVGKAKLTVSGPGLSTATLELLGQAKRSAKGSFTHAPVGDLQTLAVTFPAGRGGVPAATTLSFTVSSVSDSVGGTQEDRTLRGFRLIKSGAVPRQSVTMILDNAAAGDRINTPAGTG